MYLEPHSTFLCVKYGFCLVPHEPTLARHLQGTHRLLGEQKRAIMAEVRERYSQTQHRLSDKCNTKKKLASSAEEIVACTPPHGSPAFPRLRVFLNAYSCKRCDFITVSDHTIGNHVRSEHGLNPRPSRRPLRGESAEHWELAPVQTLLAQNAYQRYFKVKLRPVECCPLNLAPLPLRRAVSAQIDAQLDQVTKDHDALTGVVDNRTPLSRTIDPWLELTQWHRYLKGCDVAQVAAPVDLPDRNAEPLLINFMDSFDRIFEDARDSIRTDRFNVFDQTRINSFMQRQAKL